MQKRYRLGLYDLQIDSRTPMTDKGYANLEDKSFFTRDFLWWLAGEGCTPRGHLNVHAINNATYGFQTVVIEFVLNSEEAVAEFKLTWPSEEDELVQTILTSVYEWGYDNGEKIIDLDPLV